jgi:sulfite reductase (NADPH) flavoprotein alpha-component
MIRLLHRWPGLLAGALLILLAVSSAALSLFPALERLSALTEAEPALSVAELADRVLATYPGLEQIRRAPSGRITAWWFEDGVAGSAVIDPATGQGIASADPVAGERWLTNLHRSFFLGDAGRIVAALGAMALLGLSATGVVLVARRMGGWRWTLGPARGAGPGRWHVEIARAAAGGLILSSVTGLWMTASVFGLLPDGAAAPPPPPPAAVSGMTGTPVATLAALRETPVEALRELTFPYPGDATDVFTLTTDGGTGAVDQGRGEILNWAAPTAWERISDTW